IFRAQLAARAAALEGAAGGAQRPQHLGIKRCSAALVFDPAIPLEAERLEGPQHLIRAARHHARVIEVFNTYQPAPAVAARVEEAADGSQQRAEMQRPRRGRSKTADVWQQGLSI